ncbi:MAG: hypothetical protein J6J06_05850 [Bacteroidaceae bacterium]|nr:hypothetical protein [Bacteroidaceae bacterium]
MGGNFFFIRAVELPFLPTQAVEPLLRVSERNAILVWAFPSGSNLGVATFYACGSCLIRGNFYAME